MDKELKWVIIICVIFLLFVATMAWVGLSFQKKRLQFCKDKGYEGVRVESMGFMANKNSCYKFDGDYLKTREMGEIGGRFYFIK